jgi:hypothetical protein
VRLSRGGSRTSSRMGSRRPEPTNTCGSRKSGSSYPRSWRAYAGRTPGEEK